MGPGDRFDWYVHRFIGFGVHWDNFPYERTVWIYLPFVCFRFGFGLDYTDPEYRDQQP